MSSNSQPGDTGQPMAAACGLAYTRTPAGEECVDEAYTFGRHPRTYLSERQFARLLVVASYVRNGERYC